MVRVWLRPAVAALSHHAAPHAKILALKAGSQHLLAVQQLRSDAMTVRLFSSKKDKSHEKKSLHDKFQNVEEELIDVPAEVQFLSQEGIDEVDEPAKVELDPELLKQLEEATLEPLVSSSDIGSDSEVAQLEALLARKEEEDIDFSEDEEDDLLSDAELASKAERDIVREVEDDRLYIEMPGYDSSLSMASEGEMSENENDGADPFASWDQGMAYSPDNLNWMLPREKRSPFGKNKEKPWKYFVRANHPDVVELALDADLLRMFISPTGRIRARRFTGLTAKQQRMLARAIKISRQMALLPFLSRYPEPSPEQWRAMEEEDIAKLMAQAENDDGNNVDDDDDDFDDMDEE